MLEQSRTRAQKKRAAQQPAKKAPAKKKSAPEIVPQPVVEKQPTPYETLEVRRTKYVRVSVALFGEMSKKSFIVIAQGDGMKNAGIQTGDLLFMDSELEMRDGDIVMAKVNGEEMCRRIFREGEDSYRLHREDGLTPDIITKDCVVYGVMVGFSRSFNRAPAYRAV